MIPADVGLNSERRHAMKHQIQNRQKKRAKIVSSAVTAAALIGITIASAQNAQQRQQQEAEYYQHVVAPMIQDIEAQRAEIMSRPSRPILPGEMRDAVNYGAIAWYQKAPGQYGYVFNQGSIRDISASMNVDIECTRRRITCEGKRLVMNEWLVVASYNSRAYFATATGPTRAAAEALVQQQCRKDGTTCTIKDAFEVMPHRRGAGFQRIKMVVR
jgi:Domain of unknown function (DUF4189)